MSTGNNGQIYCMKNQAILMLANSLKAGKKRREKSTRTDIFEEAREVKY
jgi:hypothetical protein